MIKKQLLSKTLSAAMFAAAMLFGTSGVFAQVKIGTNPTTIGANSNLEVEATNANKTVIQKDNGNVGIGTAAPTNKLHISGSVNPVRFEGLQAGNGTETVLAVDANGVVKKQSTSTPIPTLRLAVGLSADYDATSYGAGKKVPLNQVASSDGNFSTATNLYTVPTTGVYQISGTFRVSGTTTNSAASIGLYANISGQLINLTSIEGTGYTNGIIGGINAGSVTLILNAGDTIGLSTVSCGPNATFCPQTYNVLANRTNLTIVKMN